MSERIDLSWVYQQLRLLRGRIDLEIDLERLREDRELDDPA